MLRHHQQQHKQNHHHSEYDSLLTSPPPPSSSSSSTTTTTPTSFSPSNLTTYKSTTEHHHHRHQHHHHHHQVHSYQKTMNIQMYNVEEDEENEVAPLLSSYRAVPATTSTKRRSSSSSRGRFPGSRGSSRRAIAPTSSLSYRRPSSSNFLYPSPPPHHHHHHQQQQQRVYHRDSNHYYHRKNGFVCCCCSFQCIHTQEIGILQRFGKFQKLLRPGLHCLWRPCVSLENRISLKIQQLDVKCETKTKDNVFVHLTISVLYKIQPTKAYEANYSLTNPHHQISSHILNIVQSTIPKLNLDSVFATSSSSCDITTSNNDSDSIALEVLRSVQGFMCKYGYDVLDVLVGNIDIVERKVKDSMNEIMGAKKFKESMGHRAEGEKIKKVKEAEAYAETLYLHGVGISKERKAIAHGLRDAITNFTSSSDEDSDTASCADNKNKKKKKNVVNTTTPTPKDVMDLLVLSHYFDTLTSIGSNNVLLNMNPGEVRDLHGQLSLYFDKFSSSGSSDGVGYRSGGHESSNVADIPDLLW